MISELLAASAGAQIVLSGLTTSFTKASFANAMQRANQDRVNLSLLLARRDDHGLFNPAAGEIGYSASSPADTEWATNLNNPGETIAATNFAALDFTTWVSAYAGSVGNTIVGRDAVLHIIPEDIYLDIRFTGWTTSALGGGFNYQRSKTPDGDYNEDGLVDAADYMMWRDARGQAVAALGDGADGDLSGLIDQGDYDFWEAVYGEVINTVDLPIGSAATSGLSSSATSVPEPATLWILLYTVAVFGRPITRPRRER